MSNQRRCEENSMGPIAHFSETNMLQRQLESLKHHFGDTEIHIGVTGLLGFLAVAMSYELGGSG